MQGGERRGGGALRSVRVAAALAVVTACGALAVPPAGATVGLSPGSASVEPGQSAAATVRVSPSGEIACLRVSYPRGVFASVSDGGCHSEPFTARLSVVTDGGTAPGTYDVVVIEDNPRAGTSQAATFRLTVREPAPPTTTTTTAPRPTTTARRGPTTAPPPTTAAPTTTAPTTTTEAPAPTATTIPLADRFTPLEALAALEPAAGSVLFLPLTGFGGCDLAAGPCADPDFALTFVPAAGHDLVWRPAPPATGVTPEAASGPLLAVGAPPVDGLPLSAAEWAIPVLDARPAGGILHRVRRGLDGGDRDGDGANGGPAQLAGPAPDGAFTTLAPLLVPEPPTPPRPLLASTLFGEPRRVAVSELEDPVAVVAVFGPDRAPVLALLADPGWELDTLWLPLVGEAGTAQFATVAGEVGLALAVAARPGPPAPAAVVINEDDGSGWRGVGVLLLGAAAILGGGAVLFTLRRNR